MRLPDRVTGVLIFGLGAVAAYAGSRLPPVPGQQVGPNVFPLVIGIGLCLCGLMIGFGIGRSFEEEAEVDLAAHSNQPTEDQVLAAHGPLYHLRVLIPPALLIFYALAAEGLGFYVTTALMLLIATLAFGGRLRLAVPVALIAPVVVHLVFYKLLRVPLPAGLVPMPW
ncbi:MAG TPA: tripartite tricarboxylate transporter TctB family protein [Beijerinckiaceae bacterium]|nr:tripartite tricarboxylate transporter TctB family protein [Beijerinckiaceae bacterium]